MAACLVEDALATTSIYCQTTNKMERTPSSSSLETTTTTTTDPDLHRCSFNFHTNNIKIDSTLIINKEPSRKRQLSQSETKRTVTETSCRSQAVPINESKKKTNFFKITSSLNFQL